MECLKFLRGLLKFTFLLMLKHYQVLLRLKENCKKPLDNQDFADIVLMDLSKVFDYIPPDLLVSKFHAYNLSKYAQSFVYSFFW